jgi:PilZ domain-containing protein
VSQVETTALVIDARGELALVCAMLEDLGADCIHLKNAKQRDPLPNPRRLLVTTGPLAVELGLTRSRGATPGATWMACVRGRSKTQRARLRQAGFDLLVPENVHPAALLLLLRRAVFDGENTQRATRVAVGEDVVYGTALRSYRGLLVDLSARGCRLLTDRRWPVGRKLQVRLPLARGLRRAVTLHGQVLRVEPAAPDGGTDEQLSIALQFEPLVGREREEVREILRERVAGPAPRTDAPEETPTLGRLADSDAPARYEREVTAICRGGTHTLLGRDLSGEGLHVERSSNLRVGETVRIALHGAAREEPFLVEAHVERDDGPAGWFLKFDCIDTDAHLRLKRLMADLPRIHRLDDESPTHTAVVAQLLSNKR